MVSSRGLGDVYKRQGAKAVNPDINITVEYAGSFGDAPRGRQIAAAMYANDVDVIFHASGDTGNGVFSEAKDIVANDPSRNIWVIGVDRDQEEEGIVEVDGEERHLTLTSTLKAVGEAVKQLSLIHISEPTRRHHVSRMPSSA